jgi:hypothetical protein
VGASEWTLRFSDPGDDGHGKFPGGYWYCYAVIGEYEGEGVAATAEAAMAGALGGLVASANQGDGR